MIANCAFYHHTHTHSHTHSPQLSAGFNPATRITSSPHILPANLLPIILSPFNTRRCGLRAIRAFGSVVLSTRTSVRFGEVAEKNMIIYVYAPCQHARTLNNSTLRNPHDDNDDNSNTPNRTIDYGK